ncbi:MAG TPA: tyrosine-type recombinase/integrase [Pyrinomonadaceae bacterium]|nr:tyrosine-type recombinase/integrase [Pyrinomonadaceae bacterium]
MASITCDAYYAIRIAELDALISLDFVTFCPVPETERYNQQDGGPATQPDSGELAQELRTHLGNRKTGYLFETNRNTVYSSRRVQQVAKAVAERAKIMKRVYPHLLRHSVATTLLERGMPIDQIQKFLGHSKLETTQIYAESTTEMIKDNYQRALAG